MNQLSTNHGKYENISIEFLKQNKNINEEYEKLKNKYFRIKKIFERKPFNIKNDKQKVSEVENEIDKDLKSKTFPF